MARFSRLQRPVFDALVTTDQNHQQNLSDRRPAVLVLPTTSWTKIQTHERQVVAAIGALRTGEVVELTFSQAPPL
jgi:hypothetical protein